MGAINLESIKITSLKRIPVHGGDVLHAFKNSDEGFRHFGEAYFSIINNMTIKAWKRHNRMTLNLIVPLGKVRFVFAEEINGKFREIIIGDENYVRLTVPPGIWFGFQGLTKSTNLILNIADIIHQSEEVDKLEISQINFNWNL